MENSYDYSFKFIIIGDSDTGKDEIFEFLDRSNTIYNDQVSSPVNANNNVDQHHVNNNNTSPINSKVIKETDFFRSIIVDCEGCKIRLLMWTTSGQGRFNTILRSFSRGAQGILLVYDITNKWSFNSIERWYDELEKNLPGIPKILIGNRLHLAFKRQVSENEAKQFAEKRQLIYYEISPLCDYNVIECLIELSRMCLKKIRLFETQPTHHSNTTTVLSLQELCCQQIIKSTTSFYGIDRLPLPNKLKKYLKSYSKIHKYELTYNLMNQQDHLNNNTIHNNYLLNTYNSKTHVNLLNNNLNSIDSTTNLRFNYKTKTSNNNLKSQRNNSLSAVSLNSTMCMSGSNRLSRKTCILM